MRRRAIGVPEVETDCVSRAQFPTRMTRLTMTMPSVSSDATHPSRPGGAGGCNPASAASPKAWGLRLYPRAGWQGACGRTRASRRGPADQEAGPRGARPGCARHSGSGCSAERRQSVRSPACAFPAARTRRKRSDRHTLAASQLVGCASGLDFVSTPSGRPRIPLLSDRRGSRPSCCRVTEPAALARWVFPPIGRARGRSWASSVHCRGIRTSVALTLGQPRMFARPCSGYRRTYRRPARYEASGVDAGAERRC
jgi:hypothetical protein